MDPLQIISRYYEPGSLAFHVLLIHGQAVSRKAAEIVARLNLPSSEALFIHEAALLHDIGIKYTHAPDIGCTGTHPYICHGYLGHDLLLSEGLPLHALVCERHTGAGLTLRDIDSMNGLLPRRLMEPVSLPEKIITYCDKFFSKEPGELEHEKSYEEIVARLNQHGNEKGAIFAAWHQIFSR